MAGIAIAGNPAASPCLVSDLLEPVSSLLAMVFKRVRLVQALLVIAGSVALVMAVAPTATAATARNGVCEAGEFCLYWGLGRTESVSDFNGSVWSYGATQPTCYDFKGPGYGKGQCVKNNAASAWNRTTANTVTVYYNSGYEGRSDTFTPGQAKDLNNTFLQNASQKFVHN